MAGQVGFAGLAGRKVDASAGREENCRGISFDDPRPKALCEN